MDVSISQTRIELENVVDDNSCSTKVQTDELCRIVRNQNMKHIATKGINLAYGRSKGIVLFGKDKTSKKTTTHHRFEHEKKSKK